MNKSSILTTIFLLFLSQIILAQKIKTDANVIGHVVNKKGEHIPFATVHIKGTTIGTTTDETGHYQLINLPVGKISIQAKYLGYKPMTKTITLTTGVTKEIKFELEESVLGLEEVVITADRNETDRKNASVIVNSITPKVYSTTQSVSLGDGLNFCPGLRMENNCQNCGFSQIRMNGMEGAYSQILINSKPVFSGLAGVYGLELIPSNMIERVEVIRGGGSAIYGGNAIAGTINLILKDPINNFYDFGMHTSLTGVGLHQTKAAEDYVVNFNSSVVSSDNKTGISIFGFYRNRNPFDANNDTFSELSSIKNTTIGTRLFHRFGVKGKLTADFFAIREKRRGGNKHDYPLHEADIAEAVEHNITTAALTYDHFFRKSDLLSVYVSGQRINRNSYYGARQSLSDYGNTKDFTFVAGAQYNMSLNISKIIFGVENKSAWLIDKKLGYPDLKNANIQSDTIAAIPHVDNLTIANQLINTVGMFTQYNVQWKKFKFSAGLRFDKYLIKDLKQENNEKTGTVISPRFTAKYDIKNWLQLRCSYAQGYRAPQIFDEDLHIETSGARKIIHRNDPNLEQETSNTFMLSLDFNKRLGNMYLGILAEGFFTKLNNAFANNFTEPDENGVVVYTRINAENGATVRGINFEMNFVPVKKLTCKTGFTIQSSEYEAPQEFNEKQFFRTPNNYGYIILDWKPVKKFGLSGTGNYTGKMLVPYMDTELRESNPFFDFGMKLRYNIKINGATLQLFAGVKNLFHSYQNDFDKGVNRDPAYIYGPLTPRTFYGGIKISNFIK